MQVDPLPLALAALALLFAAATLRVRLALHRETAARRRSEERIAALEKQIAETTRAAQQQVAEANARLRAILDASDDAIIGLDLDGTITFWSASAETISGHTAAEALGRHVTSLAAPDLAPKADAFLERLRLAERPFRQELHWVRKDGEPITISFSAAPIRNANGTITGFAAIARDITERTRAEEKLRETEQRYREVFENTLTAVYIATPGGRFIACNPAFARILGFDSVDEVLACNAYSFYPDPSAREAFLEQVREKQRVEDYELELRRRDGSPAYVIENAVGTFDADGNLVEIKGFLFDITERKALEEQLRQAQKMEAIGRLAGGVAHDFNNLLTTLRGHVDLLLEDLDPEDPRRAGIEEIRKSADRAAALTRQLLAFSRRQVLQPRILDLNTVVRNMENMLRRLIGEDIEFTTVLDPELGRVRADPGQLEQVIMNLVLNARDAMPDGGQVIIETANVELEGDFARRYVSAEPGPYVMLAVSDTGHGMDKETQSRIFEPFFTTKEKGTGLGLSTVYGIVKQSGGYIWVYSEPGQGTTFEVYLPRVEAVAEEPETPRPHPEPHAAPGGSEVVLLVEDEEAVRALVRKVLQRNGYRVLEAAEWSEALAIFHSYEGPIHLLLTDVVMPELSGRELAERLSQLRPEMKVLFMSGYTDDEIFRHGVLNAGAAFIGKPFSPQELAQKVREVLDAPPVYR